MSQWLPRCWNQVAKVTPGIVKKAQEILTKHPKAGVLSLLVLLGPKDMFLCMVFYACSRIFLAFFTILYHFVLSTISESMGHEMWPISMDGMPRSEPFWWNARNYRPTLMLCATFVASLSLMPSQPVTFILPVISSTRWWRCKMCQVGSCAKSKNMRFANPVWSGCCLRPGYSNSLVFFC